MLHIGLGVRVFANGPGDLGSIPGRVIPKTQKMVLDASLLNTQHYKIRIKGKVEQSREGVAPSPTHWCSSYRKGSLRVTLDYGRQLYLLYLYIYCSVLPVHWHNGLSVRQWHTRLGFNPRSSNTKDSKMVLDASLLNTQHYKVRIKDKKSNPVKRVAPSPTPWCSSYWKGSPQVSFQYGRPIYMCVCVCVSVEMLVM